MKKIILICFLWSSLLSLPITSQTMSVTYKIIYDFANENIVEIHDEVLMKASELLKYADVSSHEILLMKGIDRFSADGRRVSFKDHQLILVVGDGNGSVIEGSFEENGYCLPSVKPKSMIIEWLGL